MKNKSTVPTVKPRNPFVSHAKRRSASIEDPRKKDAQKDKWDRKAKHKGQDDLSEMRTHHGTTRVIAGVKVTIFKDYAENDKGYVYRAKIARDMLPQTWDDMNQLVKDLTKKIKSEKSVKESENLDNNGWKITKSEGKFTAKKGMMTKEFSKNTSYDDVKAWTNKSRPGPDRADEAYKPGVTVLTRTLNFSDDNEWEIVKNIKWPYGVQVTFNDATRDVTWKTAKMKTVANILEKNIDFDATTARDCLDLPVELMFDDVEYKMRESDEELDRKTFAGRGESSGKSGTDELLDRNTFKGMRSDKKSKDKIEVKESEKTVNGWTIKKLPDTADFSYSASKGGYEDKFYSKVKAEEFAKKNDKAPTKVNEGKKLVHKDSEGTKSVKVYYDSDSEEYVVKLYNDGKYYEPADYFTNDKEDAIGTSAVMLKESTKLDERILGTHMSQVSRIKQLAGLRLNEFDATPALPEPEEDFDYVDSEFDAPVGDVEYATTDELSTLGDEPVDTAGPIAQDDLLGFADEPETNYADKYNAEVGPVDFDSVEVSNGYSDTYNSINAQVSEIRASISDLKVSEFKLVMSQLKDLYQAVKDTGYESLQESRKSAAFRKRK